MILTGLLQLLCFSVVVFSSVHLFTVKSLNVLLKRDNWLENGYAREIWLGNYILPFPMPADFTCWTSYPYSL